VIYILSEDDSLAYLEGAWDRADVEERVALELWLAEVAEPVAVVLCDRSAVAFYITSRGEVV
jgi:hypothetical protein